MPAYIRTVLCPVGFPTGHSMTTDSTIPDSPATPVPPTHDYVVDDVHVWLDPAGGITIKAVTAYGDPVELSATQARLLASQLLELADLDESP